MGLEDYVTYTTIKVSKEVRDKLVLLKYKYKFKTFNDLLKYVLETFEKTMNTKTGITIPESVEEKVREMIVETCIELGEESSFFPMYLVRKYKITEKNLVEYLQKLEDEIHCSQILQD